MSSIPTSRLIQFKARLDRKLEAIDFARHPQDDDSALATAGKVAATGAGLAGAGYLGTALYRGRADLFPKARAKAGGWIGGTLNAVKTGAAMNNRDIANAYRGARDGVARGYNATASTAKRGYNATAARVKKFVTRSGK